MLLVIAIDCTKYNFAFSYRKGKLAGTRNNTLSMSPIMCLTTMDYLAD